MQKESKINPDFSTLSQTINILGSELGNVIKQQAGKNNFELVEEIRVNSKKYRSTKNSKFLELIYKRLKTLDEIELLTLTKSFTLFFYLSNISEQVFREKFQYKIDKNDLDKNKDSLVFSPVFTTIWVLSGSINPTFPTTWKTYPLYLSHAAISLLLYKSKIGLRDIKISDAVEGPIFKKIKKIVPKKKFFIYAICLNINILTQ